MVRSLFSSAPVISRLLFAVVCVAFLPGSAVAAGESIELLFAYGSEKDAWLQAVTRTFNARNEKIPSGASIRVKLVPMGSGQCVDAAFSPTRKVHLISPASAVWIKIGNDRARESGAKEKALVGETKSLVRSPIVIAMWKRMAEAIGWGRVDIGWNDLADLIEEANKEKKGWGVKGHPQWGSFKFAHTHPELSNSGLLGLIAMAYAGVDKTKNLTVKDIQHPSIKRLLVDIEGSILYYGESTGFMAKSMLARGPENISATVIYENLVIESYDPKKKCPEPIVAIYPREGTFWSDHPVGIVKAAWVSDAHRQAAEKYIAYLLEPAQQQEAVKHGFRPGDVNGSAGGPKVELGKFFSKAYGVDPTMPKRILEAPHRDVVEAILKLWQEQKRRTRLVLAIDISFSMNRDHKLENARKAAIDMVKGLGENDTLSLIVFNNRVQTVLKEVSLKTGRQQIIKAINGLKAKGSTALYDAVLEACKLAGGDDTAVQAIILLSDGVDVSSSNTKEKMLARLSSKTQPIPLIFTIAYGRPDDTDDPPDRPLLKEIAYKSRAKYYDATPENIRLAIQDINAFFGSKVRE